MSASLYVLKSSPLENKHFLKITGLLMSYIQNYMRTIVEANRCDLNIAMKILNLSIFIKSLCQLHYQEEKPPTKPIHQTNGGKKTILKETNN